MPTKDSSREGNDNDSGEDRTDQEDAHGGRQTDLGEVAASPGDEATVQAVTEIDNAADAARKEIDKSATADREANLVPESVQDNVSRDDAVAVRYRQPDINDVDDLTGLFVKIDYVHHYNEDVENTRREPTGYVELSRLSVPEAPDNSVARAGYVWRLQSIERAVASVEQGDADRGVPVYETDPAPRVQARLERRPQLVPDGDGYRGSLGHVDAIVPEPTEGLRQTWNQRKWPELIEDEQFARLISPDGTTAYGYINR